MSRKAPETDEVVTNEPASEMAEDQERIDIPGWEAERLKWQMTMPEYQVDASAVADAIVQKMLLIKRGREAIAGREADRTRVGCGARSRRRQRD